MLPKKLNEQMKVSFRAIEKYGFLPLFERIKIWELFGEYIDRYDEATRLNPPYYCIGHKRRLILQKMCVERIIPLWEKKMGGETIVQMIFGSIERYLKRGYPPLLPPKGLTVLEESTVLYIENYQNEGNLVLFPCACLSLLSISITDQNDWVEPEADVMIDELDPFGCHPDFYISQFYSKSVTELKDYWNWYLDTAIPLAYEAAMR